jgi:hypothetical protein
LDVGFDYGALLFPVHPVAKCVVPDLDDPLIETPTKVTVYKDVGDLKDKGIPKVVLHGVFK